MPPHPPTPDGSGPRLSLRALLLTLLTVTLSGSCGDGASSDAAADGESAPVAAAEPRSGEAVYLAYCATCHGESGDGKGVTQLDRPARAFRDGGFSFGNTPEAVFRTVSSGIGGTPMPGFATVLDEEQRRAVAAHVLSLGPEQVAIDLKATELAVGERAVVVRGGLPPLADGLPVVPRGLLLGNSDGLSFEYDADDLRLLAVRQGPFVDRRDWGERGGALLEPLGRVIWTNEGGAPGAFAMLDGRTTLDARLAWTEIDGPQAEVGARLLDPAGEERAVLRERGSAATLGEVAGFRRNLRLTGAPGLRVHLRLATTAGLQRLGPERVLVDGADGPMVLEVSGTTGFEGFSEPAEGVLAVALQFGPGGVAACDVVCIPLASRAEAEVLRVEGF